MGNSVAVVQTGTSIGGYTFEKKLGKGAFGEVWQAKKGTTTVAIKCILKNGNLANEIEKEVGALKRCNHENIVNYIGLLSDSNFEYIIMEFCAGGSFRAFLESKKTLSESDTKVVFRQLARALFYMNQQQIIHRDLKPDNILMIEQGKLNIKVADFGIAKLVFMEYGTEKAVELLKQTCIEIYGTQCGTRFYVAPEIWTKNYNSKVDLWSAGAMLYECLFGRFRMFDMVNELHNNKANIGEHNIGGKVSASCKDLLKKLLVYDHTRRIGFDDFIRHPFVA